MVKNSEIIAVFNLRRVQSSASRELVRRLGAKREVIDVCLGEGCASCVLTDSAVYLSPVSSVTLRKRACEGFYEDASYLRDVPLKDKRKKAKAKA